MTENHPITPPLQLVQQWINATKSPGCVDVHLPDWEQRLATQAARWGADQELEACCEWVDYHCSKDTSLDLRAARRPKPPSLKEQALETLKYPKDLWSESEVDTIRRALNELPDE